MTDLQTFEGLECYKLGRKLRKRISSLCKTLPPDERFRLIDQTLRASRSITANIAEGYGRHHHLENAQFCRQARGSLSETLEHVITAYDEEYTTQAEYHEIRRLIEQTWKVLNGYIAYLAQCAKNGVPTNRKGRG